MEDKKIYELMSAYPNCLLSRAYRMGLKDANIELSKPINDLLKLVDRLDKEKQETK